MKRYFFLLPVLFAVCLSVEAQKIKFKPEFYLGVGGGPVFSKVDFSPKVAQNYKNGYYGGISAKYISEKSTDCPLKVNWMWEPVLRYGCLK